MGATKQAHSCQTVTKIRRLISNYHYSSIRRIGDRKTSREIKYGVEVPRGTKDALKLDCENKNNLWKNAIQKELKTLESYITFKRVHRRQIPKDYKYIPLHFVFDVKSDGTRKARLVAGGHIMSSPDCPLYSTVIKTESVRIIMTIAAKQGLQVITGDVGGAYLNAHCAEKVWTYTLDINGFAVEHTLRTFLYTATFFNSYTGLDSKESLSTSESLSSDIIERRTSSEVVLLT